MLGTPVQATNFAVFDPGVAMLLIQQRTRTVYDILLPV